VRLASAESEQETDREGPTPEYGEKEDGFERLTRLLLGCSVHFLPTPFGNAEWFNATESIKIRYISKCQCANCFTRSNRSQQGRPPPRSRPSWSIPVSPRGIGGHDKAAPLVYTSL
jgi:hypothetical protein